MSRCMSEEIKLLHHEKVIADLRAENAALRAAIDAERKA